jgi:hypothetical protein
VWQYFETRDLRVTAYDFGGCAEVRAVLDTFVLYAPSMLVRRERDPVARSASDVGNA